MSKSASTILIIEDDKDLVELMTYILEEAGYTVIAGSPEGYMNTIQVSKPQVILLDYWIEHTLGSDICLSLKSNPATQHIPVILTSAVNGIEKAAIDSKADDVLGKPFDIDNLEKKVSRWASVNSSAV